MYVHVPFCRAKCRYCDFYSLPLGGPAAAGRFIEAVAAELQARREALAVPLVSAFIGGGTPTVIGAGLLRGLLGVFRPLMDERTEFTVEANPGTLDAGVIEALAAGGVNRVNLGVQSFRDEELELLGRMHTARQAAEAFESLRRAGFGNLGLDLIYGIPNQTPAAWRASVDRALALCPEHLSCYALSYEDGTPLQAELKSGRVKEMEESASEECYRYAVQAARRAGLEHYELSNFARPGRQCRHNLTYWRNEPYLGLGPGAASFLDGIRRTNLADLDSYCSAVLAGRPAPGSEERLTGRKAMAETVMLALRLREGLSRRSFAERYGRDVQEAFPRSIARYVGAGALELSADRLRICDRSLFVADTILAEIVAEA